MTDRKEQESSGNNDSELQNIIEAAFFAADSPIGIRNIQRLFIEEAQPNKDEIEAVVTQLQQDYLNKGLELVRVGNGWRFQTREKYAPWIRKLNAEKAPRYSRAQLETLAIIAYRQPVTRGDIEDVRGVAVSSDIIRILEERGWIREIGHRDVPGRPALFGTTQEFLSYFNLSSLRELPEMIEERKFEEIAKEMHMTLPLELSDAQDSETSGDDAKVHTAQIIPISSGQVEEDNIESESSESEELESEELESEELESEELESEELESEELESEELESEELRADGKQGTDEKQAEGEMDDN
ncbi:MAG: SMC-Scp complex subunit ScpB [Arenicella sp.]